MTYTNQSIKVIIKKEEYTAMAETTKCRLLVSVQITPAWHHEYEVTGWANCSPEDTYDYSIGKKISKARAVTNAYKEAYRCANKYLRKQLMYIDSHNRFMEKVAKVLCGNQKYLERFNDRKDNKEPERQKK